MNSLILIVIAYAAGVITPMFKERFVQLVKHFNEYLKSKIKKM